MKTNNQLRQEKITLKISAELAELVPNFCKNRHLDVAAMRSALRTGDYETIERLGHGMKGAGAGFGFDAVSEMGKSIESSAKIKDAAAIQTKIDELESYMSRVEVVYE